MRNRTINTFTTLFVICFGMTAAGLEAQAKPDCTDYSVWRYDEYKATGNKKELCKLLPILIPHNERYLANFVLNPVCYDPDALPNMSRTQANYNRLIAQQKRELAECNASARKEEQRNQDKGAGEVNPHSCAKLVVTEPAGRYGSYKGRLVNRCPYSVIGRIKSYEFSSRNVVYDNPQVDGNGGTSTAIESWKYPPTLESLRSAR